MADIAGLPYWEVEFDKNGKVMEGGEVLKDIADHQLRDLFVFSHGWNNSFAGARSMYADMFALAAGQIAAERKATTGFLGVLWPSLLFPEDGPEDDGSPNTTGASTGAQLAAALAPKFPGQEDEVAALGQLLDERPEDGAEINRFHDLSTQLVTSPALGGPEDNGEQEAIVADPRRAVEEFAASPGQPRGDAQGDNIFARAWHGAKELLRTASYYEMKNRAGIVGQKGLGPLLGSIPKGDNDLRLHLIGHSFGARLVSFALSGLPDSCTGQASPVKSLTLVQGAFSHYTFSPQKPGALTGFTNRVDGPLLATFSAADRAVGVWYPNASRLARQDNQGVEDFNRQWGGMGHDGYQQTGVIPETLLKSGNPYRFVGGKFYSLDSNGVIARNQSPVSGAHSDIRHPEVTWAFVSAAGLSPG